MPSITEEPHPDDMDLDSSDFSEEANRLATSSFSSATNHTTEPSVSDKKISEIADHSNDRFIQELLEEISAPVERNTPDNNVDIYSSSNGSDGQVTYTNTTSLIPSNEQVNENSFLNMQKQAIFNTSAANSSNQTPKFSNGQQPQTFVDQQSNQEGTQQTNSKS